MSNRIFILFSLILVIMSAGICTADDSAEVVNNTTSEVITEAPGDMQSPDELLMELAFKAREFALEAGMDAAVLKFSDPAGEFVTNGSYIIAFDRNGVLLADMNRSGDVGSQFIAEEYDAGLVSQMRDFSSTGGGLFTKEETGESFFILDIDGQWWVVAVSSSASW